MTTPARNIPDVKSSVKRVALAAEAVSIDMDAVAAWAERQTPEALALPPWSKTLQPAGTREETANAALLIDCVNFCFWPSHDWWVEVDGRRYERYLAMHACLVREMNRQRRWFDPRRWVDTTEQDLNKVFAGHGQLCLLDRRAEIIRQTGAVVLDRFGGSFAHAVDHVHGDAVALSRLLAENFDSFRDIAVYRSAPVAFLKRAQLCAADVSLAWHYGGHGPLTNLQGLSAFADYRLPQLLRHFGILRYAPGLSERVDALAIIPEGSPEEVEIRACTVWAVELMREALAIRGVKVDSWQIDYVLWEQSHSGAVKQPHHRTWSIFY